MSSPDTPLFVKTHDFLLWLIRHTQRFPKNLRHSYTLKLELMAFDFQEAILMANAVRGQSRSNWLATADGKLVCLRRETFAQCRQALRTHPTVYHSIREFNARVLVAASSQTSI
jgi:hypothetical protein